MLTPDQKEGLFSDLGCLWRYPDLPNPRDPHPVLPNGQHTDVIVNRQRLINDVLVRIILAQRLKELETGIFDCVVCSPESRPLAEDYIRETDVILLQMIRRDNSLVWSPRNPGLGSGVRILHLEGAVRSYHEVIELHNVVCAANAQARPQFLSPVLAVIDLTNDNLETSPQNIRIASLLKITQKTYYPDRCPYCGVGSCPIPYEDIFRTPTLAAII